MIKFRLRRNLKPRVSNTLAAFCAVLLLITSLPDIGGGLTEKNASREISALEAQETGEQDAFPVLQAATRQTIRISLMIFRH